jgi:hypothetical protein
VSPLPHPADFTSWSPEGSFTLFEERDWRVENGYAGPPIFENELDFLIVAPSSEPDRLYFGIVRDGRPWQFVQGPFVAGRENLWERIRSVNPAINADDCYLEFCDNYTSQPSLDHFIDIVTAPVEIIGSLADIEEEQQKRTKGEEWKGGQIDIDSLGEGWKGGEQ